MSKVVLDFEKPIYDLEQKIEEIRMELKALIGTMKMVDKEINKLIRTLAAVIQIPKGKVHVSKVEKTKSY